MDATSFLERKVSIEDLGSQNVTEEIIAVADHEEVTQSQLV